MRILVGADSIGEECVSRCWSWVSSKVSTGWKLSIVSWLSQEGIHRASPLLFSSHNLEIKSGDLDLGGPSVPHFHYLKENCTSSALSCGCCGIKLMERDLGDPTNMGGHSGVDPPVSTLMGRTVLCCFTRCVVHKQCRSVPNMNSEVRICTEVIRKAQEFQRWCGDQESQSHLVPNNSCLPVALEPIT